MSKRYQHQLKSYIWLLIIASTILIGKPEQSKAQNLQVGGLLDLELKKGGPDSSPVHNQTPDSTWSIYAPNVRLFFTSSISERWMASASLQSDHLYTGTKLSQPFFSALNLNWLAWPEHNLNFTIGRFITPFGLYKDRLLSSANPFVHYPLTMSKYLSVDKRQGFFSGSGSYSGALGMPIIWQRLYSQGLMMSGGSLSDDGYQFDLAATLVSASSYTQYGEHARPSIIGSFSLNPVIWLELGGSFNYGPYFNPSYPNRNISADKLQTYDQIAFSGRAEVSYHYFIFSGEYTWNRWEAPWISSGGEVHFGEVHANVHHYLLELQYRLPSLVGFHTAFRFERLLDNGASNEGFILRDDSGDPIADHGVPSKWMENITRTELVAGYDINRQMELKASYLLSRNSGDELKDNVFTIQLSAGF